MQLISYCEPRHVMLVHGEAHKMEFLKEKIKQVCRELTVYYIFSDSTASVSSLDTYVR